MMMDTHDIKPPRIGHWLLRRMVVGEMRDRVVGDFEEIYGSISREQGTWAAMRWFVGQMIKSIPSFIFDRIYWRTVMLFNYLKSGLRHMQKHKGHAFINVVGLSIGLACTILILLWVQDELSYDRFHENANEIYRIASVETDHDRYMSQSPAPLAGVLKNDVPEIEAVVRFISRHRLIARYQEKVFNDWEGMAVDPSVFQVFTFPLIKGNSQTALNELNSIVLTEKTARRCFGDEAPMGRMMEVEGELVEVTGIVQDIPLNSEIRFDYLRPFESLKELTEYRRFIWNWFACHTYVLLNENTTVNLVNGKIADLLMTNRPWMKSPLKSFLEPLPRMHLYDLAGGGPIKYVIIFTLIAFFILLIACINFMNLSTAQSAHRAKEIGLRKVVGSNRFQIVKQFFSESILITCISVLLAMILVILSLPWFNHLSGKQLSIQSWNGSMFLGLMAITLIAGFISGSYPALILSSFQPVKMLRGSLFFKSASKAGGSKSGALFRKVLVIIQFTLSIGLMVCTTLIHKQLHYMRTSDLGFDKENLVHITIPDDVKDRVQIIKHELSQNATIAGITGYGRTGHGGNIAWEGMLNDEAYIELMSNELNYFVVDYDFLKTNGITLIAGRNFSEEFSSDIEEAYLVNEEAIRRWDLESPVGKQLSLVMNKGNIIGIYKNFHFSGLRDRVYPEVLYLKPRQPWDDYSFFLVRLQSSQVSEGLATLRSVWKKYSPKTPLEYHFVDEMIDREYQFEERLSGLFNAFTFLAVFISCLGLFGLASFMAEQRTKEIGVRKVLGASVPSIIQLLSKEFSKWVLLANVISWPIAYYAMQRWLQDYPYRTQISLWIFPIAGVSAFVIALLTVSYKALRAARSNPVEALKYE